MHILCNPGLDLYTIEWLSPHNTTDCKDQEIVNINMHTLSIAVNIPGCIYGEDIRNKINTDAGLQMLNTYIITGCPHNKDDLEITLWGYWSLRHKLTIIDSVAMKGK